mgnify:CR=1 FL=1
MKVKLNNISVSFGENTVLNGINFVVNDNDKIALIGRNGCGKSTLIKVITGEQEIDNTLDGDNGNKIEKIGSFKIGQVKQITFDDENESLEGEILKAYSNILNVKKQMEELEKILENNSTEKLCEKYTKLCEEYDRIGGYTYKIEYNKALKNFGFSEEDKHKKIGEFSGGQRTKIALIKLLLSKPDMLILDEPTNHLDILAIEWLEKYLQDYKKAIIVVSHDRAFLDKFVNVVYEIERGKITRYVGNYTKFVKDKELAYQKQLKEYNAYKQEVNRLQNLVDRFRYKATKASMAQSKIKQIDRIEVVEKPESADMKAFSANIEPNRESSTLVLRAEDLVIGYDKPLATLNFRLNKGDRLGIVGGNGIGKSTLLRTIMERVEPLGGKLIFGTNLDIGYFDQQTVTSNIENQTILNNYLDAFPQLSNGEARSDLGAFMFTQEEVYKNMQDLSGGELVRLALCKIFKKHPNFLILDEPTNHLDIVGKEALENLLLKYKGTILFVSHDRYFVNKLATSLIKFENGKAEFIKSTYQELKELEEKQEQEKPVPNAKNLLNDIKEIQEDKPKVNDYLLQKEKAKNDALAKKIERDINTLESEIANLQIEFQNPDICSDFEKLMEIETEIVNRQTKIDKLTERWFELTAPEPDDNTETY